MPDHREDLKSKIPKVEGPYTTTGYSLKEPPGFGALIHPSTPKPPSKGNFLMLLPGGLGTLEVFEVSGFPLGQGHFQVGSYRCRSLIEPYRSPICPKLLSPVVSFKEGLETKTLKKP